MDCKTFEKRIPDFIGRKLDYVTLTGFVDHMNKCDNCKEELTIQFLIEEGLVRLEEGSAFDLNQELKSRLDEAAKKIKRHDIMVRFGAVMEYLLMAGIGAVVLSIIFL